MRLLVSQGKELPEVCEIICDHCLVPDTTSGAGIGCDNMTMMVIALLHGRTPAEWYTWVAERTKAGVGRKVPGELPTLYSMTRIMNYRARKAAQEERNKRFRDAFPTAQQESAPQLSPFARILGAGGALGSLAFGGGSGIGGDAPYHNGLMFDDGDSEEEEESEPSAHDAAKSLKEQLDELEGEAARARAQEALANEHEHGADSDHDADAEGDADAEADAEGDSPMLEAAPAPAPDAAKGKARDLQGEAPPPPAPLPNGSAKPDQLLHEPDGDAPSGAVRAEPFLDASEDPLKA